MDIGEISLSWVPVAIITDFDFELFSAFAVYLKINYITYHDLIVLNNLEKLKKLFIDILQ